jgi:hypothetical protein
MNAVTVIVRWSLLSTVVLLLAACSVDEGANDSARRCSRNDDCKDQEGFVCHRGFCIAGGASSMPHDDAGMGGDAEVPVDGAVDAGADGGAAPPPMPCDTEGEEDFCYTGPADTSLVGACKPGMHVCHDGFFGECTGEVVPEDEVCNGQDDDCDDSVDEDAMAGSCSTGMSGVCDRGSLVCDGAGGAVCEQTTVPSVEACNGEDDDCDDHTDEGDAMRASCYAGSSGCVDSNDDGVFECSGICKAGSRECVDGEIQDCEGAVMPATAEDCDPPTDGELPTDDDCDGKVDEGCSCSGNITRQCYSGPPGTSGHGECKRGTQACVSGEWGDCEDEIVPQPETCMNLGVDDDCNDAMDDIPLLGTACSNNSLMGRCQNGTRGCKDGSLDCVTPEPRAETCDSTDDDCAGGVDEGFNVLTDEANCGECGEACDSGDSCCGGGCTDTDTDELHCGDCMTSCSNALTCCDGGCVNTQDSEQHCGGCGNDCPAGQTCCSGTCYDLDSDNSHCGICTKSCGAATGCCDGTCTLLSLGC